MTRPNRPKTLLLDQDCVTVDFARAWLGLACDVTGRDYQYGDIVGYDMTACLGLTKEQSDKIWEVVRSPGWVAALPQIPGAREGVAEMRAMGLDVRALTAPLKDAPYWHLERDQWVLRELGIVQKHVVHAHDKSIVWGDFLVDDKVDNLVAWQDAWPDGHAVRFAQPWNVAGGTAFAAADWPGLVALVRDLLTDF